jgi:thiamine kinase-like enzyme
MLVKSKEKYNIFNKIIKFDNYLNNHGKIFMLLFPKNGLFILCHNDCQRWNFLFTNIKSNIIIIGQENSSMCPPRLDL